MAGTIEQLYETLTSSGVLPLIAKEIDPELLTIVRRDDPWETAIPSKSWDGA